jgi:hypothetical protein
MSGIEFTPFLWAIPVAMTALSSYDHRHPFASQTFRIETAPTRSDGGGLLQVFRCGSRMDVIEDDDDELQEGHYLQSSPSCDSLDKKRRQC